MWLDLAADKDIDLVVCSVRVDRHFQTVRPSIVAGKTVYVEWPLEKNLELAKEMTSLAASHNAKTIVGLQGSFSPEVQKMKKTIESGAIGRLLSSTMVAALSNGGAKHSKNVRYFLQREVGGNVVNIHGPHALEFITTGGLLALFNMKDNPSLTYAQFLDPSRPSTVAVLSADQQKIS